MTSDMTIVLITGANSGIGLELVIALAQASATFHVLLGSRSADKGQKALNEIQSSSNTGSLKGSISVLPIDVTDKASIQAARDDVERQFGRLDVLVNNAGIIVTGGPAANDTLLNLRETFETNVFGTAVVTEIFEPLLRKSAKPQLIYVSSEQGSVTLRLDQGYRWRQVRGNSYRMSKAALNMLAACHRTDYADWGCRVCSFNPGFCVTNLTGEAGRAQRIEMGARSARDPAHALVEIIMGKRDADLDKNGIVDLDGGVLPW